MKQIDKLRTNQSHPKYQQKKKLTQQQTQT